MLAGVNEPDGGCGGGGAEGEELEESGKGGVGGDCEGDCWGGGLADGMVMRGGGERTVA